MPRVWGEERCYCGEMQEMSQQESTLEETGNREVASFVFLENSGQAFNVKNSVCATVLY